LEAALKASDHSVKDPDYMNMNPHDAVKSWHYFQGTNVIETFRQYRKFIHADNGDPGANKLCQGKDAEDIILKVPLGTIAKDPETGEVMAELTTAGQKVVLLPGGRGGMGNAFFKSATRQAPDFAQPGEPGIEKAVILELKILADVGLVGFPNAGKSTLLSVVTAARPAIADYPFTTLVPNLGIVNYRDELSFVMADIPGIIEGASQGKGLGYRFLRHIERNSVLLFMVPADAKDIQEAYNILCKELEAYNPELMHKQRLLAITKSDLLDEELKGEMAKTLPKDVACLFISSVAQIGLQELKDALWKMMNHEQTGNQTTI
jgi:GTP-binding protein